MVEETLEMKARCKNLAFLRGHRDEILKEYGPEIYIVIKDGKIIDSGAHENELEKKYSNELGLVLIVNPATY